MFDDDDYCEVIEVSSDDSEVHVWEAQQINRGARGSNKVSAHPRAN